MLVIFSSKHHENITMFGDVAQKLLTLMGHSGTVPGAILADNVLAALTSLKQGLAHAKQKPVKSSGDEDDEPEVSLVNRAIPLIALLEAAVEHHCNVMWEQG